MIKNSTLNLFKRFKSIESYMLGALLGCSLTTIAQTQINNNHPLSKNYGTEDVSKRDLFSRHFLSQSGTTAVIAASVINYEKDGVFHEINTTITNGTDSQYPFANTENVMESHFGATSSLGVKSITKDGNVIEFLNGKQYWEANGQILSIKEAANVPVSISNNKAIYNAVFEGVNAEYTILNGKRKLNYVIASATSIANAPANADFLVFAEDIQIPASWSYTTTDKGVYLMDSKNNAVYLYENPYSLDANKNGLRNSNTIMTSFRNGNILSIVTKVKTSWLLSPERVFPIMVDPTATVYPNATSMHTGSVFTSDGFKVENLIAFGRDVNNGPTEDFLRGWAKFNTTSIPDNATINAGTTIYFYIEEGNADYAPANGHSLVISQIPATVDPVTASGATLISTIEQAGYQPVITATINTIGWKNHTITSGQIRADIQNQLPQNTFTVGFMPQGDFFPAEYLVASGWQAAEKPYIVISYTEAMGINDMAKNVGLYPNPVQSELFIKSDVNVKSIEVFSMLGQSVAKQAFQNSISVAHLSNGIYTIAIILEDGTLVNQKFIKN